MKLNNEYRFGVVPTVNCPRSRFLMHQNIRTTFNAGKLIPFLIDQDIMPGDTYKIKGSLVIRMSTPMHPIMDNIFADIRFFFVPYRIVWNHWKAFMGENETSPWTSSTEYTIPQVILKRSGVNSNLTVQKGSPLNYMGIRLGWPQASATSDGFGISALPLRCYQKIWNDWWRDENFAAPYNINYGDGNTFIVNPSSSQEWGKYDNNVTYTINTCAPVYKFKDRFNSNLPQPQRGDAVTLPIGQYAPVMGTGETMSFETATEGLSDSSKRNLGYDGLTDTLYGVNGTPSNPLSLNTDASKSGVIADLSNAVAATINAQRFAFATQRILESMARGGARYCEIIRNIWNVSTPMDAVLQRPEYLFGKRIPVNINQVIQTSSTDSTSPQGNTAAYSLTVDSSYYGSKSFTEHGCLMAVLCVRHEHSYSQGLERQWSRKRKLDFFFPQLAFVGEQKTLNKEIFTDGSSNDDGVFGYNERFIEYKSKLNLNTGSFSPDDPQSLDVWHLGDDYSALPVLSDEWRRETKDYIDRTLAVQSSVEDQFIMDSRWDFDCIRAVPLQAVPGLMDHF